MSRSAPDARCWLPDGISGWDGSVAGARALQSTLAAEVQLSDAFPASLRTVAGFGFAATDGGHRLRAAAVLLDAQTLQPLYQRANETTSEVPYVRALLGFRVLPVLLDLLAALPRMPDLAMVDGHGIAHPRRFGLAAHFGVVAGLPTIGVARALLTGGYTEPGHAAGDRSRLFDGDQQIGWAVRTRPGAGAVFVSPGHRVSLGSALELALRFQTRHRLPEPTHLAGRLAGQRPTSEPPPVARGTQARCSLPVH